MDINLMRDFISFCYAILIGLIIGLVYDLYRAFRYFSKPKRILSHIEDLLFWIIVGFTFFLVLVKLTDGVIRGFIFIGFFSGGIIYFLLLSKYMFSLIINTFKLILEMISEIIKIITCPFRKVFKFSKGKVRKFILIPRELIKEMGRYRKIISRKK